MTNYSNMMTTKAQIGEILGEGTTQMQGWEADIVGQQAIINNIASVILPQLGYTGTSYDFSDPTTWGGNLSQEYQEQLDIWNPWTNTYGAGGDISNLYGLANVAGQELDVYGGEVDVLYDDIYSSIYGSPVGGAQDWFNTTWGDTGPGSWGSYWDEGDPFQP